MQLNDQTVNLINGLNGALQTFRTACAETHLSIGNELSPIISASVIFPAGINADSEMEAARKAGIQFPAHDTMSVDVEDNCIEVTYILE